MKLDKVISDVQEQFEIVGVDSVESNGQKIHLIYPAESSLDAVHDFLDEKVEDGLAMDMRTGGIDGFAVSDSEIADDFKPVAREPEAKVDDEPMSEETLKSVVEKILKTESREELLEALKEVTPRPFVEIKRSRSQARKGQTWSRATTVDGKTVIKTGKKQRGPRTAKQKAATRKLHTGASAAKAARNAQKPAAQRKRAKSKKVSARRGIGG